MSNSSQQMTVMKNDRCHPGTNDQQKEQHHQPQCSNESSDHQSYYELFDKVTNHGRVFIDDFSNIVVPVTTLTPIEQEARKEYIKTIDKLYYDDYDDKEHPTAFTKEDVLRQRIVATCLEPNIVSSRSTVPNKIQTIRVYPPTIHSWVGFDKKWKDIISIQMIW
jgi:hypothetical protein